MIIEKIQLKNVQSHKFLELKLNSGLNIISGVTGTGKTSIFRAMEFVFNCSNISFNDLCREGAKELSVKIWCDNGFQVERIRSKTVNRYILSKEGCEDSVFDSFGRSLPEEIADVLEMEELEIDGTKLNLNFANQDQLNFLIDNTYSDTFKAKLFNKLTGNEVLDTLFKECNRESLSIKRNIKETEESILKQESELEEFSDKHDIMKASLDKVQNLFNNIKLKNDRLEKLKSLKDELDNNKEQQEFIKFQLSKIKTVDKSRIEKLKRDAEKLISLRKLQMKDEQVVCDLQEIGVLKNRIKTVDVDFDELKKRANQLSRLKELQTKIVNTEQRIEKVINSVKETEQLLGKQNKELEQIWKDNPVCPLCGMEKK
jgi:exonuclease SbcC